jgi:hypothetical protein
MPCDIIGTVCLWLLVRVNTRRGAPRGLWLATLPSVELGSIENSGNLICGVSSMVELQSSKLKTTGSIPSRRSKGFEKEERPMWWAIIIGVIYATGFIAMFVACGAGAGPPDMQLTLLRSLVWPLYVATGHPHGTPYPMD